MNRPCRPSRTYAVLLKSKRGHWSRFEGGYSYAKAQQIRARHDNAVEALILVAGSEADDRFMVEQHSHNAVGKCCAFCEEMRLATPLWFHTVRQAVR